ncbi:MAG: transglutaminase family protein [bacterium]
MKAKVQHLSLYNYSSPVFLESQEIRLCPRNDYNLKVINFSYKIDPEPSSSSIIIDSEGNSLIKAWFNQKTDFFRVETLWEAENTNQNEYNFIIHFDNTELPVRYSSMNEKPLKVYRIIETPDLSVKTFSDSLANKTQNDILTFLIELTGEIYNTFTYEKREKGEPYSPEFTLKTKTGSCRDLAVLFMECCRYQGFASRFVSGYRIDKDSIENTDLHAWCEVFIEGAGWKGFDPSMGLAVTNEYFTLSSSYSSFITLPIIGSYRSNYSFSELKTLINAEIL